MRWQQATKYLFVLTLALYCIPTVQADDEEVPFAGPPIPKEMEILAPYVGKWTTIAIGEKSTARNEEGYTETGEMIGEWMHNRRFVRLHGHSIRTRAGKKSRTEHSIIMTYDPEVQGYRRWAFSSDGLMRRALGVWDKDNNTMVWADPFAKDSRFVIRDTFKPDRLEQSVSFHKQANVDRLVTVRATRQK